MTWNNTDIPLAYLITFRCYGTWLHGDPRGSIDRFHNRYRSQYIPSNYQWKQHNSSKLKLDPVSLDAERRESVERAIRATCEFRKWHLRAVNVRTNHVHVVISATNSSPENILNGLKSNATRLMRQDGCWIHDRSPWADKGSRRNLWNERSIERAVDYVINGQDGPLLDFD